jgi:hypothetical protein
VSYSEETCHFHAPMRTTKAGLYTRNVLISYQLPFNCKHLPKANRVDSLEVKNPTIVFAACVLALALI